MAYAYISFGLSMVVGLLIAIGIYYSKDRKRSIEEPKFRMLEEDD